MQLGVDRSSLVPLALAMDLDDAGYEVPWTSLPGARVRVPCSVTKRSLTLSHPTVASQCPSFPWHTVPAFGVQVVEALLALSS